MSVLSLNIESGNIFQCNNYIFQSSITSDAVKPKLTQFGPVNHQNSQSDGTLLSNAQQQRTSIPLSTPKSNVTGSKLQTGR